MNTRQALDLLRTYESRNVTFIDSDGSWPIVWEKARGVHVWDAEGKRYLDLTAAFGVAAAGHANPRVVRAGQRQMARLLHAMGDVHPHRLKAELARELSRVTFERWRAFPQCPSNARGKTIFCSSGFEAVEAAMKTARLAAGKPGVIAFEGGYHGLGYGALNATHRERFRSPFQNQLAEFGTFLPFPMEGESSKGGLGGFELELRGALRRRPVGAILIEPIQVRGGIRLPARGLLPLLRRVADEHGAALVFDEIYTGFGRTGRWFGCEWEEVAPDLVCLGKALTGGFPLSACVGRADWMDAAWPASDGEAIHTSTFLGHPVGCAMALAQLKEIRSKRLVERSRRLGEWLVSRLKQTACGAVVRGGAKGEARGRGLLAGLELYEADGSPAAARTFRAVKAMLQRGFILLPEGDRGNVIGFTPPLTVPREQLEAAVASLEMEL